ncbi:hypothetical protein PHYBLDRAFT_142302 [Phycomyces blakesleeanus NRRL 1555(-)]|uniref:Uncharacterized protein n=1 Tax=Phycomyces blakesleeanus (strain ATCC 8743b / DSM 1359 / FGSC 10004 / NBRC 33097 / NRRL 1555) TaxID=763407 RepID=A0A167NX25_PHYB8|nr:hypothetical protein PHYBLDRAFT_142302 [Phycomyces blakesleeanus NRRL 1555(-)]OAD76796.1 hypothetical protein PHYBLDRAFT_142302 [Phycomyces blakesleeanus NRRL 1555(-)]|eukprot:XP_018294836.1 hypothetical protein PHYBLDRAFT_142302 [Phycomyces blakesleeanus NRRL 1555(-)]
MKTHPRRGFWLSSKNDVQSNSSVHSTVATERSFTSCSCTSVQSRFAFEHKYFLNPTQLSVSVPSRLAFEHKYFLSLP